MSQPRKEDIRGQLSDIQKKLFGARPKSEGRQPVAPPPSNLSLLRRNTSTGPNAEKNGPNAAQNSQSALVPKLPLPNPQLRPESKGQDMDFVVGLSENLLSECRRLTAENHTVKSKMKTQLEEIANYKAQVLQLLKTRLMAASNELDLKDKNWDLETNVANLSEELESVRVANEKLVKSNNEAMIRLSSLQRDNDEYQLKALTMLAEYAKVQEQLKKENADLYARIEALNDENDELHIKVTEKVQAQEEAKAAVLSSADAFIDVNKHTADSMQEADDEIRHLDEIIQESGEVLSRQSDPKSSDLEVETIKANLAHSNQTISRLRAALLKVRSSTASSKNTPNASKVLGRDLQKLAKKSQVYTPAKKNAKFILLNDSEHESNDGSPWPADENWEDFIGNDAQNTPSKPSRKLADSGSDSEPEVFAPLQRTNSYLQDSDSSGLEFEPTKKSFGQRVLSLELSANHGVSEEQVQQFASDNNLVLLSLENYAKLQYNDISDMSIDRVSTALDGKGYIILSKAEHDELVNEQEMRRRLEASGIVSIPGEELEVLKSTHAMYENPEFGYLSQKLKLTGYEPVDTEHLASLKKNEALLENPSESFLYSKCKAINIRPVPFDEYDRLKSVETDHEQPLKAYLTLKAKELGLSVFTSKELEERKPLIEQVRDVAKEQGFAVVGEKDLAQLRAPSVDELRKIAAERGLLVEEEPSVDQLQQKSAKFDHSVISNDALKSLREPNLDFLEKRAKVLGYRILLQKEVENLNNPSLETLQEKAVGHTLLKNEKFDMLKKLANEPSLALVQKHAERHNLVTLESAEYTDLFRQAHEPTVEQLCEKSHEKGFDLVKTGDHEKLKALAEKPGRNFLATKAKLVNCELVSVEKLREDRERADVLGKKVEDLEIQVTDYEKKITDLNEIIAALEKLKSALKEEITHLTEEGCILNQQLSTSNGEIATLKAKIAAFDSQIGEFNTKITALQAEKETLLQEISELSAKLKSPDETYLVSKSRDIGSILLKQADYDTLKNMAEDPDLEHVSRKAQKHGYETIAQEQLKSLKEPSLERISEQATKIDQKLLPNVEFTEIYRKAYEPTEQELAEKAGKCQKVLVLKNEYQKLKNDAKNPTLETMERASQEKGYSVVSIQDLTSLKELAHNPKFEHVKEKGAALGMKLLPAVEFDEMVKCSENPTLEYLQEKAQAKSRVLLDAENHTELKRLAENPTLAELKNHSKRLKISVIPTTEYEQVKACAESPSIKHLQEKASKLDHVVIESMVIESPDFMKEKAKKHGFVPVEAKKYEELVKLSETPSADFIKEKAEKLGLVAVLVKEHDALKNPLKSAVEEKARVLGLEPMGKKDYEELQRKAHSPSVAEIQVFSEALGHDVIPLETLKKLKEDVSSLKNTVDEKDALLDEKEALLGEKVKLLQTPSTDYVREHSQKLGFELVSPQTLQSLKNPEINRISELAEKLKHKTVPQTEYNELLRVSKSPKLEELSKFAKKHNSTIVKSADFENLQKMAESPDLFLVQKHAENHKHVLVPKEEYAATVKMAKSPSIEHVKKSADSHDHVVVPKSAHEDLQRLAHEPDIEHLHKSARKHEHVVMSKNEHEGLRKLAHEPEEKHILEVAKKHNLVVLPVKDHESLVSLAKNPTLEHLSSEAKKHGHVVIPEAEFLQVSERAHKPSLVLIKEHAEKMDCEVLEKKEIESLRKLAQHPPLNHVTQKAAELQYSVVPNLELKVMKLKIEDPGMEALRILAEKHKNVLVPERELSELKKQVNAPEIDYLREKAGDHNHTVVSMSEFSAMKQKAENPLEKHVKNAAKTLGLVTLSLQSHKELKKLAQDPELAHIKSHAERLGHATLPKTALQDLKRSIDNPSMEYLTEKVSSYGYVAVPSSDFEKHLEDKEKIKNMKLITHGEYNQLKTVATLPSLAFLEEHAKASGSVLVEEQKFQEMKNKLQAPGLEFLVEKADLLGKSVIDLAELENLQETVQSPDTRFLEEKANEKNMILLPLTEHTKLTKSIKSPSFDYLSEHSEKQGYKMILGAELEKLHDVFRSPSLDFLEEHAEKKSFKLITAKDLEGLRKIEKEHLSPDLEYLKKFALIQNCQVISSKKLTELEQTFESPTADFLEKKASLANKKLISHERFKELIDTEKSYKEPSVSYLKSMALHNGHTMVLTQEWEEPSVDYLQKKAKNHVLLPRETHDKPPVEYLREKAKTHGHVLVSEGDLSQHVSNTARLADAEKKVQDTEKKLEEAKKKAEETEKKLAESQEMILETKRKLEESESTTKSLEARVAEKDQQLSDSEAQHRENYTSVEYLREKAGELSHKLLSEEDADEYEKLRQFEPATAKKYGYRVVPEKKYDEMEQRLQTPDVAYLTDKSTALGHVLVSKEEHGRLLQKDRSLTELAEESGQRVISVETAKEAEQNKEKLRESEDKLRESQEKLKDFEEKVRESEEKLKQSEENLRLFEEQSREPEENFKESAENLRELDRKLNASEAKNHSLAAEIASLSKQIDAPLREYLQGQAASIGCILVDQQEHDSVVKQAKAKHGAAGLSAGAKTLGFVMVTQKDHETLSAPLDKKLADAGLANVSQKEYERLLEPDVDVLKEKAAAHGYTMCPADEYHSLQEKAAQTLEQQAQAQDMALLSKSLFQKLNLDSSRLQHVEKTLEQPSMQYLESLSAKSNCVVLTSDQYDDFQKEKKQSIFEKAAALSLVAIPSAEYEQMKLACEEPLEFRADKENKTVLDRDVHEKLLHPAVSDVSKFAEQYGYVLVDFAQFDDMKRLMSESLEDKAKGANMILIPLADHKNLASFKERYESLLQSLKDTQFLRETSKNLNMELVDAEELAQMRESIEEKAEKRGLVVISLAEFTALREKASKPSLEDTIKAAESHDHKVISSEELSKLHESANRTLDDHLHDSGLRAVKITEFDNLLLKANKPSTDQISAHATRNGMVLASQEDYAGLQALAGEPLEARAEKAGLSLVPKAELLELRENVELPSEVYLSQKSAQKGYLFAPDVDTLAEKMGVVVLAKQEYENLESRHDLLDLDDYKLEKIQKNLQEQGYVIVHTSKYEFMKLNLSQCTEEQLETAAKSRGLLVFSSSKDVVDWMKNEGFNVRENEFEDAGENFNIESLQANSARVGMVVVDKNHYESLKNTKELSREELISRARDFNLFVLEKAEYQKLKDSSSRVFTEDEIRSQAEELGFKVISVSQFHAMKTATETLQDPSMLSAAARELKHVCVPEKAFVPTTKVRVPEPGKLTLIPSSYYEKLSRSEALNVEKMPEDSFQKHAEKRGYSKDLGVPFTPILDPNNDQFCNYSPSTSLGASPKQDEYREKDVGLPTHASVQSHLSATMDSLTGLSIATNISLTDRSMIQAITQVVIGEYLFKYFRKLGPLSSISASRHERYFWVHPYSLTLYWSSSNPVLTNPSDVKTKAIAIERVESVDDSNPLPTGLHYKSIVVHSRSKSVRITCPTRQRHNIWYNALRYLVNKNVSELDFKLKQDPDELYLPDMDVEPSSRHAFPRSSTISTSKLRSSLTKSREFR